MHLYYNSFATKFNEFIYNISYTHKQMTKIGEKCNHPLPIDYRSTHGHFLNPLKSDSSHRNKNLFIVLLPSCHFKPVLLYILSKT